MTMRDLGLLEDRHVYRTAITCDAPDCQRGMSLDIEKFVLCEAKAHGGDAAAQRAKQAQVDLFVREVKAAGWVTWEAISAGVDRHFCPQHAPATLDELPRRLTP